MNVKCIDINDDVRSTTMTSTELSYKNEKELMREQSLLFSKNYIFGGISIKDNDLIFRLELFTIMFIIIWLPPFLVRMYEYKCKCYAPIWAIACHHYSVALFGFGNAIVWGTSKTLTSFMKNHQMLQQQYTAFTLETEYYDIKNSLDI